MSTDTNTTLKNAGHAGERGNTDKIFETASSGTKSTSQVGRISETGLDDNAKTNWGKGATRSVYSVFSNGSDNEATARDLLKSRLWKGVPQLTTEQMKAFEAAHTGHQFFFVVDMPKFMTQGIYKNKNMHQHAKNIKAIIERCCMGFNGPSDITADFDTVNDGNSRKIDHVTRVYKDQSDISLTLHEFAGLPLKNGIEAWLTGIFDYRSEHAHYHGNLGIPGGWCLANHSMSLLVVQTDPTWTVIQDAAYYFNMVPESVPSNFDYTKGDHSIVADYQLNFKCNEERSPAIMYAAEKYMNARILSLVETSVFNSRQFVPSTFMEGTLARKGFNEETNSDGSAYILDRTEYNEQLKKDDKAVNDGPLVKTWDSEAISNIDKTFYDPQGNEEK